MGDRVTDRPPWWLWPNLLALDAPAVALVWQEFLASRHGVAVPFAARAALGLAVWGVYLLDRAMDVRAGRRDTARHRFAARFPATFAAGGVVAAAGAGMVAALLPWEYVRVGAMIATAVAAYGAAVRAGWQSPVMKPLAASIIFAAGVAVPLVATRSSFWWPDTAAFAGLCWCNCLVIGRVEDGAEAPPRWAVPVAGMFALAASLAGSSPMRLVTVLSLLLIPCWGRSPTRRINEDRALADIALLTPLLILL